MSNYTKSTNFATKDALSSGNALKIVKGTEIDTEFNNIATAIATKADLASPTFTGTPSMPTGTTGVTQTATDSSTKLATTAFVQAALQLLYPVGTIYTNSSVSTNPATLLGFGTWTAFAAGKVMVGFDSSNELFNTAEETGGYADAITVSHTHSASFTGTPLGTHRHYVGSNDSTANDGSESGSRDFVRNADTGNGLDNYTSYTSAGTPAGTVTVTSTGSDGTNKNYQPYVTVYMWKREA